MENKYLFLKLKLFYMLDNKEICIYLVDNILICLDCIMELLDEVGFEEY